MEQAADTNGFEFLDLFFEVSVLCMVLLVFSTCSDALGQLHFGFGYQGDFVGLWVRLEREQGHTPGRRCLWERKWLKTLRSQVVSDDARGGSA